MTLFEKRVVDSSGQSRRAAKRARNLLAFVETAPGQRYLDVGAGNAVGTEVVSSALGLDSVACDIDLTGDRAERARILGLTRFVQADAGALPFDDGSFDIVACYMTIHHLPDWPVALDAMLRVVRPGGVFVFADMAVPSVFTGVLRSLVSKRFGLLTHDAFRDRLDAQGFMSLHERRRGLFLSGVYRRET